MKREIREIVEILIILGTSVIVTFVVNLLGFPTTFNQALLYVTMCRVAQHSIDLKR